MRRVTCEACRNSVPMNESVRLFGRLLCQACAEAKIHEYPQSDLTEQTVQPQTDPTVCANCGADGGSTELPTMLDLPVCEACHRLFLRRPFPAWVKATAAAVLVLLGVSMARNWRFFQAYRDMRRASAAWKAGEAKSAAALMSSAAARVPESPELAATAKYIRAHALAAEGQFEKAYETIVSIAGPAPSEPQLAESVRLLDALRDVGRARQAAKEQQFDEAVGHMDAALRKMPQQRDFRLERDLYRGRSLETQERAEEALAVFRQIKRDYPEFELADDLILQAEAGAAFEAKDYDAFLAKARELEERGPRRAMAVAQVASALACKYAVTGQQPLKDQALKKLQHAAELVRDERQHFEEYRQRILHRLNTREIISKKEYDRRFGRKGAAAASAPAARDAGT